MDKKDDNTDSHPPIKDWEGYYRDTPTGELPWFADSPDEEVIAALERFCPSAGNLLDLGTGPGTMAIEFARRAYSVTACDISATALETAMERAGELATRITFLRCDIREGAPAGSFDIVNDRGCFHCMRDGDITKYIKSLCATTSQGAFLLLKTFSVDEPGDEGPVRYSPEDIKEVFSGSFTLLHNEATVFKSTLDHNPKAILSVLKKNG